MEYLYMLMAFMATFLLLYLLLPRIFSYQHSIDSRLLRIRDMQETEVENRSKREKHFYSRIIIPLTDKLKNIIQGITPKKRRNEIEAKLKSAGYPFGFTTTSWIIFRIACAFLLPAAFLFFIKSLAMTKMTKIILVSIVAFIGIVYPNTMLRTRINRKKKRLLLQLADTLDLLTISVEAGLSLDAAMDKVVEKSKGELSAEFDAVINEMKLGKTRRSALSSMSQRCNLLEITSFISAVIQAEQMGVGVAKVLRIQAAQARDKRKQRAKEQAMKAPVRMLLPLVICIFPTIFIVILGPAMIQIYNFLIKR